MNWTSNKPTVQWSYWYRHTKKSDEVIVFVNTKLICNFGGHHVDELSGEWAGPIFWPYTTDGKPSQVSP